MTPKTSIWDLYEDYFYEDSRYRNLAKATSLPVQDLSSVSLSTFLVAGGSLAFGLLLCVAIVLRLRKTWKSQALKERKSSLALERPKPTVVLVPLLAPAVPPSSPGSPNTLSHGFLDARDPRSPYDITNRDYFFPG